MKELINKAFKLNKVEKVKQRGKVYDIEQVCASLDYVWYVKNDIMTFTYEGDTYVIPYCHEYVRVLESNGFTMKPMYVPFSNDDVPVDRISEYELKIRKSA